MVIDFSTPTWEGTLKSFLLHVRATRAVKTVRYYNVQLSQLVHWVTKEDIPLAKFGKRHMDAYLVTRSEAGKAQLTLHHDAVCAVAFLTRCQKNDMVERSLLADYEVRNAPRPPQYMPEAFAAPFGDMRAVCDRILTAEEMQRFSGCLGYALKATLAGEELSTSYVCYPVADGRIFFTVLEFGYASVSSTRTTPDFFQAFATARQYIFEGTPVRASDREGKGTKDTRLVEGIDICNLSLYVR